MRCTIGWTTLALMIPAFRLEATPANRAALARHYDRYLAPSPNRCTTRHLPSPDKDPQTLEEFPHNPFGHCLRLPGEQWAAAGGKRDIAERVARVAEAEVSESLRASIEVSADSEASETAVLAKKRAEAARRPRRNWRRRERSEPKLRPLWPPSRGCALAKT